MLPRCAVHPLSVLHSACCPSLHCCSRLREQQDLNVTGEILYNGRSFDQFVPERSASYISQVDLHYGEGSRAQEWLGRLLASCFSSLLHGQLACRGDELLPAAQPAGSCSPAHSS